MREPTDLHTKEDYQYKTLKAYFQHVNTVLIGKVVTLVDDKIEVSVFNKAPYIDNNNAQRYRDIQNITIRYYSFSVIKFQPKVDDLVLIVCSQSDSENVFNSSIQLTPSRFSLSDAIALPISFGYDQADTVQIDADKFAVTNEANDEIIDLVHDLFTQVGTLTVTDGQPLSSAPEWNANVLPLLTKLDTFVV